MPAPVIPTLPTAPSRNDAPDTFVARADAHVAALTPWTTAANNFATYFDTTYITSVDAIRDDATNQATTATTQSGIATTQAGIATTQATLAQDWATKTSGAVSGGEYSAKYHAIAAAASAASAVNSPGTQATSSTSMTIGAVSQSFMLQQTGKAFAVGQWVNLTDSTNPSVNWMAGAITAFNSSTGAMTVNVVNVSGSGTLASWVVAQAAAVNNAPVYGGYVVATNNFNIYPGDAGKYFEVSGNISISVTNASFLGTKWYCYIKNTGTFGITLDPVGTDTIDGLGSLIMYPNEARLIFSDGTAGLHSIVISAYSVAFTTSGTWTKPPGYSRHDGLLWGGGGGGCRDTSYNTGGGGGGGCTPFTFPSAVLPSSVAYTIGAGGAAVTSGNASAGGNSSFNGIIAYGGSGACIGSGAAGTGGAGGGMLGAPSTGSNSAPAWGGAPTINWMALTNPHTQLSNQFGGGGAYQSYAGDSVWGGGGGGTQKWISGTTILGAGDSVYGGGGGSGAHTSLAGGSVFGGSGGVGYSGGSGNAGVPSAPGGGGGSISNGGTGLPTSGARGELRIWGVL